jgi:AAA+ superfamily predicted ATPase
LLGFELGRPLKEINSAELLSRYVGGTAKQLEGLFKEAKE